MSENNLCSLQTSNEWLGGFERWRLYHFEVLLWDLLVGDYLSFNFIIHLLPVITFPLILCSVTKNTLVRPVLPITSRRTDPSNRTRSAQWVRDGGNECPAAGLGRARWSLGQHGLFLLETRSLNSIDDQPQSKNLSASSSWQDVPSNKLAAAQAASFQIDLRWLYWSLVCLNHQNLICSNKSVSDFLSVLNGANFEANVAAGSGVKSMRAAEKLDLDASVVFGSTTVI